MKKVAIVRYLIVAGGVLCVSVLVGLWCVNAQAEAKGTLITVHDQGKKTSFLTDQQTLRAALKKAKIDIDAHDAVEPSLDEKLVASEYQVNIYRARPVVVVDGVTRTKIISAYQTAAQIVKDAGITLYAEDKTSVSQSTDLVSDGAGLVVTITRATPIQLTLYGKTTTVRTQAKTVAAMLKEKSITLGAKDRASVPLGTAISNGLAFRIWREGKQTITVDETIDFTTRTVNDADQLVGYKNVQTVGVNGTQSVSYEIEIQDGVEVSRTKIASIVTTPAVEQVEVVGTRIDATAGYSSQQGAIMTAAGVSSSDQPSAAYIINHENGLWCPTRWQGQSICSSSYIALYATTASVGYGLCQATPGSKMASAGSDWQTNPVTQMKWCSSYAVSRYGGWQAAAAHWQSAHSW